MAVPGGIPSESVREEGTIRKALPRRGEPAPHWLLPGQAVLVTNEAHAALDALLADRDRLERNAILAGSELDWLIGYLSETDEHAAVHARRGRAALTDSKEAGGQ